MAPAASAPPSAPAGQSADSQRSPFHAGERLQQTRAGMREQVDRFARRGIRDFMTDQHRELFNELPYVLVGSLDRRLRPWASMLTGLPGFMTSPGPRTLQVNAVAPPGDPLHASLALGAPVGLLGIQLETRRRNRMNGAVVQLRPDGFDVRVKQSFGNCPQYIQARKPHFVGNALMQSAPHRVSTEQTVLSGGAAALVRRADTFFIATASSQADSSVAAEGVDVSHRGGKPGFVRVTEQGEHTVLTIPDFRGNFFFNTLGNIALHPCAGLTFVDFDTGDVLCLTGHAEVLWDGPELEAFAGAERLLRLRISEGVWLHGAIPLRWSPPEFARQLEGTGSWQQ